MSILHRFLKNHWLVIERIDVILYLPPSVLGITPGEGPHPDAYPQNHYPFALKVDDFSECIPGSHFNIYNLFLKYCLNEGYIYQFRFITVYIKFHISALPKSDKGTQEHA